MKLISVNRRKSGLFRTKYHSISKLISDWSSDDEKYCWRERFRALNNSLLSTYFSYFCKVSYPSGNVTSQNFFNWVVRVYVINNIWLYININCISITINDTTRSSNLKFRYLWKRSVPLKISVYLQVNLKKKSYLNNYSDNEVQLSTGLIPIISFKNLQQDLLNLPFTKCNNNSKGLVFEIIILWFNF